MADRLKGRYTEKGHFRQEFLTAIERLRPLGGQVIAGEHDYEAFIYEGLGVRLVFYPHTTSGTGNRHIRIRATGQPDREALRAAIFALAENTSTFQFPADRALHNEAVIASVRRQHEALMDARRCAPGGVAFVPKNRP